MFTTPVHPSPSPHKIVLSDQLFCVGSCFAQRMGQRWSDNKFTTLVNPFGTLYHPLSIFSVLKHALDGQLPDPSRYVAREEYYFHYDFHSDLHAPGQEELQHAIRNTLSQARAFLSTANWIIITMGSAFAYERLETGQLVANCHKQPGARFRKRLLTLDEIDASFHSFLTTLDAVNPNVHLLFTVSPVRHLRDTLTQNSVSKATLRLAADQWCRQNSERLHYFPSYEIMLDELRDYRYYEADMLHPSTVAEDYLWRQLTSAYLDKEAQEFLRQWTKMKAALRHRPFHPASPAHQQFLRNTLDQLKQLSQKVDVYTEIMHLEQQLIT